MSTTNPLALYKNSNLAGQDIAFEILLNAGLILQPFTNIVVNNVALPAAPELLIIYGDVNAACFIQLDADMVFPAQGVFNANMHFIPAGCMKILDGNGATKFGIVRAGAVNGTIIVECAHNYKDTKKTQQHTRS